MKRLHADWRMVLLVVGLSINTLGYAGSNASTTSFVLCIPSRA